MGNDPNKFIGLHITNEDKNKVLNEQKSEEFFKIYQNYSLKNGFLTSEDFNKLIKIEEDKILEEVYDIFTSKKGKMYFNDLKNFYISFTNDKLKSVLLSFLLFGRVGKVQKNIYINNLTQFININDDFLILGSDNFLKSIISNDKGSLYTPISFAKNYIAGYFKDKDIYYDKNLFIKNSNDYIEKKKFNFYLFKEVIPSSTIGNKKIYELEQNKYIYVCDCLLENTNKNIDEGDELEEMRDYFIRDKATKNGHLLFSDFETIMKEIRVNQKLIDLVIKFLKIYTMKDYMNFKDFKNLMSNIYTRQSFKHKKNYLFKMLLTICNEKSSIKATQLLEILQIENKEYKLSGTINEKSFESFKDPIINSEIDTFIGYMDNLGLLPYIKYNVKPIGQELKKKIINFILENRTAEEYLIENFDKNSSFYPINMDFWKSIVEPGEIPDVFVNNSKIAEEDKIYYMQNNENEDDKDQNKNVPRKKEIKIGKLQEDLEYGKHYVIICGELFQKISDNFEFDYLIKLDKVTKYLPNMKKEEDSHKEKASSEKKDKIIEEKLEINKERNCLSKKGNEKNCIKEYIVDFYPVKIIQMTMTKLINYCEKEKKILDDKKEQEEWEKKSKEEKEKILKEQEITKKNIEIRSKQYMESVNKLQNLMIKGGIEKSLYDEKIKILNEQYKDIFEDENEETSEVTKLKKSEFFEILKIILKDIVSSNKSKLQKQSRYSTLTELKDILIYFNNNLKSDKFNLMYYTLENKFIIPKDEASLIENRIKEFALVIIDIKNNEGESNLSILERNEKNKKEEKKETSGGDIEDKVKNIFEPEILSKDELKKIKNNINEKEKLKKQQRKKNDEKNEEKNEEEEPKEQSEEIQEKEIRPPYGIPNFGNTCYFNSINQIFFNLPILQQLFMSPKLKYFINKNNEYGFRGKFISAFIQLYQLKPSKIEEYSKNLKILVGKIKDTFNNHEQQDANEYLNFILETLHEELNLKSKKRYIVAKEENSKYNSEEELGDIAWANSLRRNVSFIDSIFMFQLKSNLTCKKCGTKKINFETNYVLDLPLSLCKMVTVNINLYRLPFKYKVYYDKINKDFSDYTKLEENKDKNIIENLWSYYAIKLNYEQKLNHSVSVKFGVDFERQKSIEDIIKLIRSISLLELEQEDCDMNKEQEITEYKIKHYTEFIVYNSDRSRIIKNDSNIGELVDVHDKIRLNIYEILNTNGLSLIRQNKEIKENLDNKNKIYNFNLFSYKFKKKGISKLKDYEKTIESSYKNKNNIKNNSNSKTNKEGKDEEDTKSTISASTQGETPMEENKNILNIISINDKLNYYEKEILDNNINIKNTKKAHKTKFFSEYLIPIVHYKRNTSPGRSFLFVDFYHSSIKDFPQQFLIFNNSNHQQITPKYLYNYIWDYNSLYMNHPNKKTNKFWFNIDFNSKSYTKKCFPFVIRIVKKNKKYSFNFQCSNCQWYNFCIGCILYPDDDKFLEIKSDSIIFVDWCNSLIKEEFDSSNFSIKEFSNEEITKCIESKAKNDKSKQYQSIKDCFDLFFEKESLEDPLSCNVCGVPQNFIKNYEIDKLPYVLILSLKRFKYNENINFKLKQLITYPITDFELKNKKYDLYGVVYHFGSINSGHYTCAIKYKNRWVMCDDRRLFEIEEENVMSSSAYLLFYISKESINNNSYYNSLSSLMQHIVIDKNKKEYKFEDNNFFKGEPVNTPYGEGYIMEDYIEDFNPEENLKKSKEEKTPDRNNKSNNGLVKVKFDFGTGVVYKDGIEKQILDDIN